MSRILVSPTIYAFRFQIMENSETTVDTPSIPLSKNAQKRLLKEQKRKEMWKQKRQHEKEKRKEKKRKMQEEGILPAKESI